MDNAAPPESYTEVALPAWNGPVGGVEVETEKLSLSDSPCQHQVVTTRIHRRSAVQVEEVGCDCRQFWLVKVRMRGDVKDSPGVDRNAGLVRGEDEG